MSAEDLIWLAGYLEGEGSFMDHHKTSAIHLGTTDLDVARTVQRLFEAHKITVDHTSKLGKKPVFRVYLYGERARQLMRLLRPWMHKRRGERIDQVLAAHEARVVEKAAKLKKLKASWIV